jgi:hypothetical protein
LLRFLRSRTARVAYLLGSLASLVAILEAGAKWK